MLIYSPGSIVFVGYTFTLTHSSDFVCNTFQKRMMDNVMGVFSSSPRDQKPGATLGV